ncbi:MAG TPA: GNAT family N-acetyltransferase [Anaerolineae bacterium]|nr:GNAT family N-acetyltransferase [Anaerolineae bacterium]
MDVQELQDRDRDRWDRYVQTSPLSTFFHLSGWRDVWVRSMGSRALYLFATEGDRVVGILPLLHVRSLLSGQFLTSLPGGLCAEDDEAAEALLARARELLAETGARYLILRDGLRRWELPGLVTSDEHCTFTIDVSDGAEKAYARLRRSTRKYAMRGVRAGVGTAIDQQALGAFYPAYAEAMRERGTPTPGRRFFETAMQHFPDELCLLTVVHEDNVLGGGFVAPLRDTVFCTWSGLPRQHFELYNSYLLYWGAIGYAAQLGMARLDMGRCRRGTGSYDFKVAWGGEEQPLYQHYYLNGIEHPPQVGAALYENPKYRFFSRLWQRLPLPVAEALGPQLRRRMPFG